MRETERYSSSYRRLGPVVLRVIEGPDRGRELKIDLADSRGLRGGRAEINELVLQDEHVSASHFELKLMSRGVLLRDLNSTNGVVVAGVRVLEALLEPNAVFYIGDTAIQLVATDQVEVPLAMSDRFEALVGCSDVMRELFAVLERLAQKGDSLRVMIGGETGTGKELVARGLHMRSPRSRGPFIVCDCTSIPRDLAESILFGHYRGTFTGAVGDRMGYFEAANGGTLFLDEIGELPLDLQAKLLRVLETQEISRVGEHTPKKVNVRVLCATHRDLRKMVSEDRFRQDLYFRLADFRVHLPSLRERGDDVLVLANLFLENLAERGGVAPKLSPAVAAALRAYSWPGNVRELRSVVGRAALLADGPQLTVEDLMLPAVDEDACGGDDDGLRQTHKEAMRGFERKYFMNLLNTYRTRERAAKAAGMTTEGLRLALKRLELRADLTGPPIIEQGLHATSDPKDSGR